MIAAFCVLAFAVRCWNLRDTFVDDRIYFIDPDCYSRMTRAASIAEGGPLIIRHHDFENWPNGITPHTTAPMDWLIAGLKVVSLAIVLRGLPVYSPTHAVYQARTF